MQVSPRSSSGAPVRAEEGGAGSGGQGEEGEVVQGLGRKPKCRKAKGATASSHTGLLGILKARLLPLQKEQGLLRGVFIRLRRGGARDAQ